MYIMYSLVFVASLIYSASLCSGKVINMDNDVKEKEWLNAAPFMRRLQLQEPPMEGKDIVILQNLLRRYEGLQHVSANGRYDDYSHYLLHFQDTTGLPEKNIPQMK